MTAVPPPPPRLTRSASSRVLAGVCAGLAEHLRINVAAVRVLFAVAALVNGIGLIGYGVLWAMVPVEGSPAPELARPRRGRGGLWVWLLGAGAATMGTGVVLRAPGGGSQLTAGRVLPLLLLAAGVVVVWSQLDEQTRARLSPSGTTHRWRAWGGIVVGVTLCVAGVFIMLGRNRSLGEMGEMALAVLVVLGGIALLAMPWLVRTWNDLRTEQAERARATERADIAAHLHDSVLQTLALIQRRAADPAAVARLARAQERELRGYLYGAAREPEETLGAALAAVVEEVEDRHAVPVELVVSGDTPLDADASALVQAVREALLNAVRHGAPPVTAFVEVGPEAVEAFVRDHGPGFDVEDVPADRLGVRGSVIGRMERHGGTARIRRRSPGTEVELCLPRATPPKEGHP